jgi:uncharacterized protein YqeY
MLREQLSTAMKEAMKAKEQVKLDTIRMVQAAIKHQDIEARAKGNQNGIDDGQILSLMQNLIKSRKDSVELYEKGGRPELAAKETAEIKIIEGFLPKQMNEAETTDAVKKIITDTGATSIKDMGKVMAELRAKYAGQLDMGQAGAVVKQLLAG